MPRALGVEEELLLVDPETGRLRAVAPEALRDEDAATAGPDRPRLQHELFREQIEVATRPCLDLAALAAELRAGRARAAEDAERAGAALAATSTPAQALEPQMTAEPRYHRMAERYGFVARHTIVCGTHVHVELGSDAEGVRALDTIRPWLPVLLALSVNSPFWAGEDTGYASWRTQLMRMWPASGPTERFGTATGYREAVDALVASTAILDEAMVYFDARVSARYPTLEVRVADMCTEVEDTLLVAGLTRALVETAARHDTRELGPWRADLLRASTWLASRWGMTRNLLDPVSRAPRPAYDVVGALVSWVRPTLEEYGDLATVEQTVGRIHQRGTGSVRQRAAYAREKDPLHVMRDVVERTRRSFAH